MATFEYRQAEEIRDAFTKHGVRYLFIGKSGAILLGYPDTTQDADVYVEKSPENGEALVSALEEPGAEATWLSLNIWIYNLAASLPLRVLFCADPVNLIFAPDGIERFEDAWRRRVEVEGFMVCHPDDIIGSKEAASAAKTANRWNVCAPSAIIGKRN